MNNYEIQKMSNELINLLPAGLTESQVKEKVAEGLSKIVTEYDKQTGRPKSYLNPPTWAFKAGIYQTYLEFKNRDEMEKAKQAEKEAVSKWNKTFERATVFEALETITDIFEDDEGNVWIIAHFIEQIRKQLKGEFIEHILVHLSSEIGSTGKSFYLDKFLNYFKSIGLNTKVDTFNRVANERDKPPIYPGSTHFWIDREARDKSCFYYIDRSHLISLIEQSPVSVRLPYAVSPTEFTSKMNMLSAGNELPDWTDRRFAVINVNEIKYNDYEHQKMPIEQALEVLFCSMPEVADDISEFILRRKSFTGALINILHSGMEGETLMNVRKSLELSEAVFKSAYREGIENGIIENDKERNFWRKKLYIIEGREIIKRGTKNDAIRKIVDRMPETDPGPKDKMLPVTSNSNEVTTPNLLLDNKLDNNLLLCYQISKQTQNIENIDNNKSFLTKKSNKSNKPPAGFHLLASKEVCNPKNNYYPDIKKINDVESFKEAVRTDHCACLMKNGERARENAEYTDILMVDIDNSKGQNYTIENFQNEFSKYEYYIATSKSHQREKGGKTTDRFHIYFPLGTVLKDMEDRDCLQKAIALLCKNDGDSNDRARYFNGAPDNCQYWYNPGISILPRAREEALITKRKKEENDMIDKWVSTINKEYKAANKFENPSLETLATRNINQAAKKLINNSFSDGEKHSELWAAIASLKSCGRDIEEVKGLVKATGIKDWNGMVNHCYKKTG